jgi:hypothetical protein
VKITTKTVTYNDRLFAILTKCFAELLESSHEDDRRWSKIAGGIHKHGLLSFTVAVPRADRHVDVDTTRLNSDSRYRKHMAQQLKKPAGPDFRHQEMPLERTRLSEPVYLNKMAGILAYRWMQKIGVDRAAGADRITLLHLNASVLAECLDRMYMYESTARGVSHRIMHRFAEEIIDNDPEVQRIFGELNTKMDEIEAKMKRDVDSALARIAADTNAKFDALKQKYQRPTPQV